jgi:hypothetical protein
MMGERRTDQAALFYEFSLERHVPATHLLRSIGLSIYRTSGGLLRGRRGCCTAHHHRKCNGGSHEGCALATTRASDLRDAAVWTSEAVCGMTIPSVDTARFSREPPEEV